MIDDGGQGQTKIIKKQKTKQKQQDINLACVET
jgi:hypothetical protein